MVLHVATPPPQKDGGEEAGSDSNPEESTDQNSNFKFKSSLSAGAEEASLRVGVCPNPLISINLSSKVERSAASLLEPPRASSEERRSLLNSSSPNQRLRFMIVFFCLGQTCSEAF